MTLRVLIIPDKFKGTLTAAAAAQAIAKGWHRVRPGDQLDVLPMSDGGDGFGEIFGRLLGARRRTVRTFDAAHRPCRVHWWFAPVSRLAVIESASVIGLAMLPPGRYHPFDLDTFGLGAVLKAAARAGARRCLIGIGGSATNDGGFGLARALGWRFTDSRNRPITRWVDLAGLSRLNAPALSRLGRLRITVASDVQNPLLGPRGASQVYGPQKGLRPTDLKQTEQCLRTLAAMVRAVTGTDFARVPGAGAAGGLGFGLFAFASARAESGIELFSRHSRLTQRLRQVDLVITGEGCIDRSTLMGKGVGDIARRCRTARVPCLGLAGMLGDVTRARRLFTEAWSIVPNLATRELAGSRPAYWLDRLARSAAEEWSRRSP